MIYLDPSVISYAENDTVLLSEIYEELAKIIDHEILTKYSKNFPTSLGGGGIAFLLLTN